MGSVNISDVKEMAEALVDKGNLKAALETYKSIKEYADEDPRIHMRLGDICHRLGYNEAAIDYYRHASDAYTKEGALIQAIAACKIIKSIEPALEDVQERIADLHEMSRPVVREKTTEDKELEAVRKLPHYPIFSDLNRQEFSAIVEKVNVRSLKKGDYLFREGDEGDSLYIVAGGEVEVIGKGKGGCPILLATLKEGDFFGEFAFFLNAKRSSDVRASVDATLLELTKSDIDSVVAKFSSVGKIMLNLYKERILDRLIGLSELFSPMSSKDRKEIIKVVTLSAFKMGEVIVKEGEEGEKMYLIKDGTVRVTIKDKTGNDKLLGELSEGEFFGEVALATNRPRVATVTAKTDVKAIVFSRALLKRIMDRYPTVKEILTSVIKERVTDIIKTKERWPKGMV